MLSCFTSPFGKRKADHKVKFAFQCSGVFVFFIFVPSTPARSTLSGDFHFMIVVVFFATCSLIINIFPRDGGNGQLRGTAFTSHNQGLQCVRFSTHTPLYFNLRRTNVFIVVPFVFVVCCWLFVACCLLFVVHCLLFVVCGLLLVVCCGFVVCLLLSLFLSFLLAFVCSPSSFLSF